ncbi:MAG: single-stranded DNA-binding protein [Ruminococcus sp.]
MTASQRPVASPELKTTQNGIPYTRFRIAVNRRFHNKDEENKVDFFNATAWRGTAEFICKYFGKGSMIMLDGEMQTQQYEDRNGNPAIWYDVAVDRVCFTGEPKKENGSNGGYNRSGGNGGYGNSSYNGGKRSYGNRQNSYGNNSYNGQQSFNAPPADDYPF